MLPSLDEFEFSTAGFFFFFIGGLWNDFPRLLAAVPEITQLDKELGNVDNLQGKIRQQSVAIKTAETH